MSTRTIDDVNREMRELLESADGRNLTADEIGKYTALEAELAAVRRSNEIRARQAAYDGPAAVPPPPFAPDSADSGPQTTREYRSAFRNYLRTGKESAVLLAGDALAQQSSSVPSEGGILVPTTMRDKLVEALKAFGGLANVVDIYSTGTGNPVLWPTIDDTGNQGEIVEENGTFSAGADLVFGDKQLSSYTYATSGASANPIRVPWELIQDADFDIEALIARLFAIRIARIQAYHWVNGTGVKQPEGILLNKTPVQAAANTGITYDDLVTWKHSVDPAYRAGARWAFNDNTAALIEKIKDSHGDPVMLTNRNLAGGTDVESILGYPVTIDQAFPDYDLDAATAAGVFGNLQLGYVIRRVRDVQIVVNPYNRSSYRQTEISAWARADAVQQQPSAYIAFSGKA